MSNIKAYTDGAYSANRNLGGIGIVFVKDDKIIYEYSKCLENTTNNRCELYAVIKCLQAISKPIDSLTIISDSQYVIYSINKSWQRKKNKDLWLTFDKYYEQAKTFCCNIKFEWVKGHASNEYNNRADILAVQAYECKNYSNN